MPSLTRSFDLRTSSHRTIAHSPSAPLVRRRLRLLVSALGTAGFIISADKAAREFELRKYAVGSGTELERISHAGQRLEREAGIGAGPGGAPAQAVTTREAVIEWAKENRWTAVGLT